MSEKTMDKKDARNTKMLQNVTQEVYFREKLLTANNRAKVYLVSRKSDAKIFVAKYSIKNKHFPTKECKIWNRVNSHTNIVTLVNYALTRNRKNLFLMEYADAGDLFEFVDHYGALEENVCQRFLQHMVSALDHLHSKHILHQDVKPENIFLFSNGSDDMMDWTFKLGDFDLATQKDEKGDYDQKRSGSPNYVAPEYYFKKLQFEKGPSCDIWSLGVVFYAILIGHNPWNEKKMSEMEDHLTQTIPTLQNELVASLCSFEAIDLCLKMLTIDPKKRITLAEIQKHDFMSMQIEPETAKEMEELSQNVIDSLVVSIT